MLRISTNVGYSPESGPFAVIVRMSALCQKRPKLSLLDKTGIQAQVLVPILRALRAKLGKAEADALVKEALRTWSQQLFAAIVRSIDGNPRRKWAAINTVWTDITEQHVTSDDAPPRCGSTRI